MWEGKVKNNFNYSRAANEVNKVVLSAVAELAEKNDIFNALLASNAWLCYFQLKKMVQQFFFFQKIINTLGFFYRKTNIFGLFLNVLESFLTSSPNNAQWKMMTFNDFVTTKNCVSFDPSKPLHARSINIMLSVYNSLINNCLSALALESAWENPKWTIFGVGKSVHFRNDLTICTQPIICRP